MIRSLNDVRGSDGGGGSAGPQRSLGASCWQGTPAVTKLLVLVSIVGSIVGAINPSYVKYTAACPYIILSTQGLTAYTFLTSWLSEVSILSGIFAGLCLFQTCSLLESKRGSLYVLHCFLLCNMLTNGIWLGISYAVYFAFDVPEILNYCCYGMWASFFTFVAIETTITAEEQPERNCCGLFNMPTKMYPWVMLLIFELLNPQPSYLIALLLGYVYINTPLLQLSYRRASQIESWRIMRPFTSMGGWVFTDSANSFGLFNPLAAWAQPSLAHDRQEASSSGRTGGSGTTGSGSHVVNIGSGSNAPAKPSVFQTGTGHKLNEPTASTSLFSSSTSATQPAAASAGARPGVDRLSQLAKGGRRDRDNNSSSRSSNSSQQAQPSAKAAAPAEPQPDTTAATAQTTYKADTTPDFLSDSQPIERT